MSHKLHKSSDLATALKIVIQIVKVNTFQAHSIESNHTVNISATGFKYKYIYKYSVPKE